MNSEVILCDDGVRLKNYGFNSPLDREISHVFVIQVSKHYPMAKKMAEDLLSDREQDKASRLFNAKDKERYLVSKFCLKHLLSSFMGIPIQEVDVLIHAPRKQDGAGVCFNISHTGDIILLAISSKTIGIDVERLDTSFDFQSILNVSFSKAEIDFIGQPIVDVSNFYSLWTRKEALFKAVGQGISDNFHHVDCLEDQVGWDGETFNLKTFCVQNDYLVSMACQQDLDSVSFWYWD